MDHNAYPCLLNLFVFQKKKLLLWISYCTCCNADSMETVVLHFSKKNRIQNDVRFYQADCNRHWLACGSMHRYSDTLSKKHCIIHCCSSY